MKKILSSVLVCVMLLGCVFALASCTKQLSGTYECKIMGQTITYEFNGNEVSTTYPTILGDVTIDGEYVIEDDEIEITYENDIGNILETFGLAGKMSFNEGSDNDGKYIELNGTKFYRK